MISICFDRPAGQIASDILRQVVLLFLLAGTFGCASAAVPPVTPAPPEAGSWERLEVERNSFSKKVRFRDLETSRTTVMKYKGLPVAWGSPLNLIVDEDIYQRESHRVRYRFSHPISARPMILMARAKSHHVASVRVRTEDSMPVVQLFDQADMRLRGTLRYDERSPVLFSGEIEEREVEIEQVSAESTLNQGLLGYLLFPFPVDGDFVIRVEGREAARFTQRRQHGFTSSYELDLDPGIDQATREDATLAFIVFDLMKDFVYSNL